MSVSNVLLHDGLIRVLNTESEDIPAHSVAQVIDVRQYDHDKDSKNRSFIRLKKPDGERGVFMCVPRKIIANKPGFAYSLHQPRWLRYTVVDDEQPENYEDWGPVENDWTIRKTGSSLRIWGREMNLEDTEGSELALCTAIPFACPTVWELYIDGNPTSGSVVWSITINDGSGNDTQDVDIAYDDDASDVLTELLAAFTGLTSANFTITGGPLTESAIYIEFAYGTVPTWAPGQGTLTLNNSAAMKWRKSGD